MKKYNWIFLLILFLSIALFVFVKRAIFSQEVSSHFFVTLGETTISVQIADLPREREKGLGGRATLGENEGMLFLFDDYSYPLFWMKDMRFPIDIIWIRDDTIVGFHESVPPPENNQDLPKYTWSTEVNRVLEVRAGFVEKYKITPGTTVQYSSSTIDRDSI